MNILLPALLCLASLAVLAKSADEFVDGAVSISKGYNLSPVVVGALVLGFGTSVPEFVVSSIAAVGGESDVGVGNIVGSNLANLSLVLGTAATVTALACPPSVLRREGPLSLAAVLLFAYVISDGRITTVEGVVLVVAMVGALGVLLTGAGDDEDDADATGLSDDATGRAEVSDETRAAVSSVQPDAPTFALGRELVRTIAGLLFTVGAGWVLILGAERIAEELNLTGGFIAFTMFAIGTSMPELVTALAAARKGETDLILGNLFGSNVFNRLTVGAGVALLGPEDIGSPRITGWGNLVMVVVIIGVLLALYLGKRVVRWQGIALLGVYLATVPITFERDNSEESLSREQGVVPAPAVVEGEVGEPPGAGPQHQARSGLSVTG